MRRVAFVAMAVAAGAASSSSARADDRSPPPQVVHQAPLPDQSLTYHSPVIHPTWEWLVFQLLPSPELAFGRQKSIDAAGKVDDGVSTAFGLRWQVTPVLWSFGVHRRQSRWRYFIVDPFARHSGSLELSTSFEYIGGQIDSVLVRPGVRAYLPILAKGESLSASLGTSIYRYEGLRVAYDVGVYTLSGLVGLQLTVAPTHQPLAAIATLRLKYF